MRALLKDLEPGYRYIVQLRSKTADGAVSAWSRLYDLRTVIDEVAPTAPANLQWVVKGKAFEATWDAPTTNADGTQLVDLKQYKIKVSSASDSTKFAEYTTTATRWDFTLEMNANAFSAGTPFKKPIPNVNIEVRAEDSFGNLSLPATASAAAPAPPPVTNLTARGTQEAIFVTWDGVEFDALDHYEVDSSDTQEYTPDYTTIQYRGMGTSCTIDTGVDYATHYIKVAAVDVFGQASSYVDASATPKSSFEVDTTAPPEPTISAAQGNTDGTISVIWTYSNPPADLAGFIIRYRVNGSGNTYSYHTVYDATATDFDLTDVDSTQKYDVGIAAFDSSANQSAYSDMVSTTPAIPVPSSLSVTGAFKGLVVTWRQDVAPGRDTYEIQIATDSGFTNTVQAENSLILGQYVATGLDALTTYYVRVRENRGGSNGGWSAIGSAQTTNVQDGDLGQIDGSHIIANSLSANTLKAGTTFTKDLTIGSMFTIDSAGLMQSSNFSAGSAGWQLTDSTLEINDGTISAKSLQLQFGQNIIPLQYADFEFDSSYYSFNTSNVIATIDGTKFRYGQFCLKVVSSAAGYIDLATSTSDYNINTVSGSAYIVSVWSDSDITDVSLRVNGVAGSTFTQIGASVNGFTRYYAVFTASSSDTFIGFSIPTARTVYLDGVQVEEKLTGSNIPSSWTPPSVTTIDGGMIKTGQIQSNSTTTVSGVTLPDWSINLNGNAQFNNAWVRGKLIVGPSGQSGNISNISIESGNYAASSAGYSLRGDGSVEFNNGTFRGAVYASSGNFTGYISSSSGYIGGWSITSYGLDSFNNGEISGGVISGSSIVGSEFMSNNTSGQKKLILQDTNTFAFGSTGGTAYAYGPAVRWEDTNGYTQGLIWFDEGSGNRLTLVSAGSVRIQQISGAGTENGNLSVDGNIYGQNITLNSAVNCYNISASGPLSASSVSSSGNITETGRRVLTNGTGGNIVASGKSSSVTLSGDHWTGTVYYGYGFSYVYSVVATPQMSSSGGDCTFQVYSQGTSSFSYRVGSRNQVGDSTGFSGYGLSISYIAMGY